MLLYIDLVYFNHCKYFVHLVLCWTFVLIIHCRYEQYRGECLRLVSFHKCMKASLESISRIGIVACRFPVSLDTDILLPHRESSQPPDPLPGVVSWVRNDVTALICIVLQAMRCVLGESSGPTAWRGRGCRDPRGSLGSRLEWQRGRGGCLVKRRDLGSGARGKPFRGSIGYLSKMS